jgi:hypothetical protein
VNLSTSELVPQPPPLQRARVGLVAAHDRLGLGARAAVGQLGEDLVHAGPDRLRDARQHLERDAAPAARVDRAVEVRRLDAGQPRELGLVALGDRLHALDQPQAHQLTQVLDGRVGNGGLR